MIMRAGRVRIVLFTFFGTRQPAYFQRVRESSGSLVRAYEQPNRGWEK
jgi:hypothetical protein